MTVPPASAEYQTGPREPQIVSITLNPVFLALPLYQVKGEYRLGHDFGVAAFVGDGKVTGYPTISAGVQANYYLIGSFHNGMQLGVEVWYLNLADSAAGSSSSLSGTIIGPYIGYKIAASFGLTADIEVGVGSASISESGGTGQSSSFAQTGVSPIFDLGIGWSF